MKKSSTIFIVLAFCINILNAQQIIQDSVFRVHNPDVYGEHFNFYFMYDNHMASNSSDVFFDNSFGTNDVMVSTGTNITAIAEPKMNKKAEEEIKNEQNHFQLIADETVLQIICGINDKSGYLVFINSQIVLNSINNVQREHQEEVKEFLEYHFHRSLIAAFQWVGISATLLFICRFFQNKLKGLDGGDDFLVAISYIISWISVIGCFACILFGSISSIFNMAKIKDVPRTYIVEYVRDVARINNK